MLGPQIGILALQGGYAAHAAMLERLAVRWCYVRSVHDLKNCDALILPGGESTTQSHLARSCGLDSVLTDFAEQHPLLGTCAGLILMSRCADAGVLSLQLLDVQIERNAYGRQRESFTAPVELTFAARENAQFPGVFIRAPQINDSGTDVDVLARWQNAPVLVAQGAHFGMSFHPELTQDAQVHVAWLQRAFDLRTAAVHYAAR